MKAIFFLLLLPFFANTQLPANWEKTFGGNNDENLHGLTEATNGWLVATGETSSNTAGGKDGLFLLTDFSTGNPILQKVLGGKKDDALFAATQTFDGRFLLAGSTESKGKGGKDAWLLLVDEQGAIIWDTVFGGPRDDGFRNMVSLDDGKVVLVGQCDDGNSGDVWLVKWDWQKRKTVWEKEFGKNDFEKAKAIAALPDGSLALTGNCDGSPTCKKGDIWVLKVRPNGDEEWRRSFDGDGDWDEAQDIIATRDGNLAVAGMARTRTHDLQAWLLKINRTGTKSWGQLYGGRDIDLANSLTQAPDGGFFLNGKSKSYDSGARNFKQYLVKTTPGGDLEWEQTLGGARDDEGTKTVALHDGSLVLAGRTASVGNGGDDAWLVSLRNEPGGSFAKQKDIFQIENLTLATPDGTLKPGDRTWLEFDLTSTIQDDLENVHITLESKNGAPGVRFWEQAYLSRLMAGTTQKVRIPVAGEEGLQTADLPFEIKISAGKSVQNFPIILKTRLLSPPELVFLNQEIVPGGPDEWTLNLQVQNKGDLPSGLVTVEFLTGDVAAQSDRTVTLGFISSQRSSATTFRFQTKKAQGEIIFVAKEGGLERRREKICWGCQSPSTVQISYWHGENGPINTKITADQPVVEVEFFLINNSPLQPQVFNLKVNGVIWEGSKFKEKDIQRSQSTDGMYIHHCRKTIRLVTGENRAVMEMTLPGGGVLTSVPLLIEYKPERRNLFILAIGVPHADLQYTDDDARDFAAAFERQQLGSGLFDQVFTTVLTTPEATTLQNMKEEMESLFQRWRGDMDDRIGKNDMVLVFISSHGTTVGEQFRLLPSDYNDRKPQSTTVNFRQDVLEHLDKIDCKKILFLDACHSGAAGKNSAAEDAKKSRALEDALAAWQGSGMATFSSCKGDQLSYEDQRWQNGAFTEALLDALKGGVFSDKEGEYSADDDGNGFVSLGELNNFLQRRVPDLLQSKSDIKTSQTPSMLCKGLKESLPVFLLK